MQQHKAKMKSSTKRLQGGHHSDSTSKHEQVELEAEGQGQAAGSLGFKLSLGSGLA